MDEPSTGGVPGQKSVAIENMQGDIVMVSTVRSPPEIPAGKGRCCPQCSRKAWRLTRHCWNCGFDFGSRMRANRLVFLAAVASLAAAIANAIIFYSSGIDPPQG